MSQQRTSVYQWQIHSYNCTCCHTETKATDQTLHFTQSQYSNTRPTSTSIDLINPGIWQGNHWNTQILVISMTWAGESPNRKAGIKPRSATLKADASPTGCWGHLENRYTPENQLWMSVSKGRVKTSHKQNSSLHERTDWQRELQIMNAKEQEVDIKHRKRQFCSFTFNSAMSSKIMFCNIAPLSSNTYTYT